MSLVARRPQPSVPKLVTMKPSQDALFSSAHDIRSVKQSSLLPSNTIDRPEHRHTNNHKACVFYCIEMHYTNDMMPSAATLQNNRTVFLLFVFYVAGDKQPRAVRSFVYSLNEQCPVALSPILMKNIRTTSLPEWTTHQYAFRTNRSTEDGIPTAIHSGLHNSLKITIAPSECCFLTSAQHSIQSDP